MNMVAKRKIPGSAWNRTSYPARTTVATLPDPSGIMHIFTGGILRNWSQRNLSIKVKASCQNAISSLKLHIRLLLEEKDIQEDLGVDEKELNF
jgi:hypothetical protein